MEELRSGVAEIMVFVVSITARSKRSDRQYMPRVRDLEEWFVLHRAAATLGKWFGIPPHEERRNRQQNRGILCWIV